MEARKKQKKETRVYAVSKHANPELPAGFEGMEMRVLFAALTEALSQTGYKPNEEDGRITNKIDKMCAELIRTLNEERYNWADVALNYLWVNNPLANTASRLVEMQVQQFRNKYEEFPDNTYFEAASKLFSKCNAVWQKSLLDEALKACLARCHNKDYNFYPLLRQVKNPHLLAHLSEKMAELAPQAEKVTSDELQVSGNSIFTHEVKEHGVKEEDRLGFVPAFPDTVVGL